MVDETKLVNWENIDDTLYAYLETQHFLLVNSHPLYFICSLHVKKTLPPMPNIF